MAIKIKGNIVIDNGENLSLNGTANIIGNTTLGNDLTVSHDLFVNNDVTITDDITIGEDINVGGDINGTHFGIEGELLHIPLITVSNITGAYATFNNDVSVHGTVRYEVDGEPFCPIVDLKTGWTWDTVTPANCPSGGNGADGWWLKDYNYATINSGGGYRLRLYTCVKRLCTDGALTHYSGFASDGVTG